MPHEEIDHSISVKFNNEPVPGSPFLCRLLSSSSRVSASGPGLERVTRASASGPGLERVQVGEIVEFFVPVMNVVGGSGSTIAPKCQIIDSHAEQLPVRIAQDPDDPSRFRISYTPKHVGNHQVNKWSIMESFQVEYSTIDRDQVCE